MLNFFDLGARFIDDELATYLLGCVSEILADNGAADSDGTLIDDAFGNVSVDEFKDTVIFLATQYPQFFSEFLAAEPPLHQLVQLVDRYQYGGNIPISGYVNPGSDDPENDPNWDN